jgi:hypothetical protein
MGQEGENVLAEIFIGKPVEYVHGYTVVPAYGRGGGCDPAGAVVFRLTRGGYECRSEDYCKNHDMAAFHGEAPFIGKI